MNNQGNPMSQNGKNNALETMQPTLAGSEQNAVMSQENAVSNREVITFNHEVIMTENAGNRNGSGSFNIHDHIDKLTPASKKGYYLCPVCGDDNFSVAKGKNAYRCHSNLCRKEDIRNAIAPLTPQAKQEYRARKYRPKTVKEKDKDAQLESAMVEAKVQELFRMVESGSFTPAQANVDLGAWCKQHGHDKYSAVQLFKEHLQVLEDQDEGKNKPRLLKEYQQILDKFGHRLRFNFLHKWIELDGEEFPVDTAKIEFIIEHGMDLRSNRNDLTDVTVKIAKKNTYSPVVEYLDEVSRDFGESTSILNGIAERYLGTSLPIHQVAIEKFLIGAVARAYNPGCKLDTALILQGAQGAGKSSFFRVLASDMWFDDSFGAISDTDERLKLHQAWITEWAELETVFRRRDIAQVKSFMTTQVDRVRPPYGRRTEYMRRPSVFVGTTNQQDFLTDSTGNRRFWVVPTQKKIDIQQLADERDQIWAAAVTLYRQNATWWMSDQDESTMAQQRELYEAHDTWMDEIATYVQHLDRVAIAEVLETVFGLEKAHHDNKVQRRVRECLTRLGWGPWPNSVWHLGKTQRVWARK